jgi:peroxiredoxin Q/BCP
MVMQILKRLSLVAGLMSALCGWGAAYAEPLAVGQPAPKFELSTQSGQLVKLADRQGQGWTVLYFYPKAGTPGCTKQACAFRDAIKVIRDQQAEVYGISTDSVSALATFHAEHKLTFNLLSDADGKVTEAYGVKMPLINIAKRWTFIVDAVGVIRFIDDKVDPVLDAQHVADKLKQLQAGS